MFKGIIKTRLGNLVFSSVVGGGALVAVAFTSAWATYKIATDS